MPFKIFSGLNHLSWQRHSFAMLPGELRLISCWQHSSSICWVEAWLMVSLFGTFDKHGHCPHCWNRFLSISNMNQVSIRFSPPTTKPQPICCIVFDLYCCRCCLVFVLVCCSDCAFSQNITVLCSGLQTAVCYSALLQSPEFLLLNIILLIKRQLSEELCVFVLLHVCGTVFRAAGSS